MTELLVSQRIKESVASNKLIVDPFDISLVQPNSLDVRMGTSYSQYLSKGYSTTINPADETPPCVSRQISDYLTIRPGDFILVNTLEYFELPNDIFGMVQGKSSSGRLGLDSENAGLIDSGFKGTITLELYNKTRNITYRIPPGFPIAQVTFFTCEEVEVPYSELSTARYCGQRDATPYRVQKHDTDDRTTPDETDGKTTSFERLISNIGRTGKRGRKQ